MGTPDYQEQADQLWYVCGSAKIGGIIIGAVLWVYLTHQQKEASRGNAQAAKSLILPVYLPLITGLMVLLAIETVFTLLGVTNVWDADNSLSWAVYEWIRDGFGCLFLQSNVSRAAFKRAGWMSVGFALYGVLMGGILRSGLADNTLYLYHACIVFWYVLVVSKAIKRRDSMLGYAVFMITFRSSWLMYYLITNGVVSANLYYPLLVAIGMMELSLSFIWYLVLKTDTQYWRVGCFQQLTTREASSELLNKLEIGLLSDTNDAVLGTDLPALIEQNQSRLIDFAYLDFDETKLIGQGAFSRVYRGLYKSSIPVAVKFFVRLQDVTPDTIALYAKETSILATVANHENVVKFYGLCVRPPAILLVMEYCSRGSLFDVIRKEHKNWMKIRPAPAPSHGTIGGYTDPAVQRRLLQMCLDVSRSLAYLHSISIIHRDLKSLNYLVTENYTVKLTDFGLSRTITMGENTPLASDKDTPGSLLSAGYQQPINHLLYTNPAADGRTGSSGSSNSNSRSSSGTRPGVDARQQSGGNSRTASGGGSSNKPVGMLDSEDSKSAVVVVGGVALGASHYSTSSSNSTSEDDRSMHTSSRGSLNAPQNGAAGAVLVPVKENQPLNAAPASAPLQAAPSPKSLAEAEEYTRRVGSPYWMSPEMLSGQTYTEQTDVYSLCVVLWEIWTGSTPFPEASRSQLHDLVVTRNQRPPIPTTAPTPLQRVLAAGWDIDARKRPSAAQIVDVLTAILNPQPSQSQQPSAAPIAAASSVSVSGSRPPPSQ